MADHTPKTLVILNPAARSDRAAGLVRKIEELAAPSSTLVRITSAPGQARRIAEWAVSEG